MKYISLKDVDKVVSFMQYVYSSRWRPMGGDPGVMNVVLTGHESLINLR